MMGSASDADRKDINHIQRLQNLIWKEATNCAEYCTAKEESNMSEMARLVWRETLMIQMMSTPKSLGGY